jgi:hypothetical protein
MAAPKHARYGPLDRYNSPPAAGMCLSVFVVARRGSKVLAGVPRMHERWTREWAPNWLVMDKADAAADLERPRLPNTYVYEREDPAETAARVLREQVGVKKFQVKGVRVLSYPSVSESWYPGQPHWDLAFVYDVRAAPPAKTPPWWRELGWMDWRARKGQDWGWNEDLYQDLGLLPTKKRK